MKKTILSAGLFCLTFGTLDAQISEIHPFPQQTRVEANSQFKAPASWKIVTDKKYEGNIATTSLETAGPYKDGKSKFTVYLGTKGDKAVKAIAKLIPDRREGYAIRIEKEAVYIGGADQQGMFYGVQSLLDIMKNGNLECGTVTDWPDVAWRGVVEGFYGTPWSHETRLRQFDFYARNKMNVYIYGPKDDPYHRSHWREDYPETEAARISELARYAAGKGVKFYWAIHPGLDIKWTESDRDALVRKLEHMYDIGVRAFAVFFDDIWGEGAKADKQAELLNYVDDHFVSKKPDVSPLIMCPTEYNRAWADDAKGYLRTLGKNMNKGVEIMWTGNSVVHCLDKPSMEWINDRIERKAYIWWNFPVSDFVRDHILLGPAYGNGLDIAGDMSGFVSNPMEHAEASKIGLYNIADYTWNMKAYNYEKSWEEAIRSLLPSNAAALRTFAVYNEDLGPNGHGFRRDESRELQPCAKQALNGESQALENLHDRCRELRTAVNLLLADKSNLALIRELRPWLLQAKLAVEYGTAVIALVRSEKTATEAPLSSFMTYYEEARSLQAQMYELENSDVRHPLQPGIKVATKILLPTLNQLFAQAVTSWNERTHSHLNPVAEYQPYHLVSTVPQLRQQPISSRGNEIRINPSNEVITWPSGSELIIEMEQPIKLQGLDFDFGAANQAENFKLTVYSGNEWKPIGLLHYKEGETTVHTGNEIAGMSANKIRLTNASGKELKLYLRSFRFSKQ